jgi:hypothetical protein
VSENEEEDVGYKKPPKSAQWKPGQSGNPNGRPKKSKDFEELIEAELNAIIRITENGQTKTVTKRQALAKGLVNSALKGEATAKKLLTTHLKTHRPVESFEPDEGDREALESHIRKALDAQRGEKQKDG